MKREKVIQKGEMVYYMRKGTVKRCKVLYSAYDGGIRERYYTTDGLCFVHSDIGNIVFRSPEEALSHWRNKCKRRHSEHD